jgi:lysophospholipase L1-like esterase
VKLQWISCATLIALTLSACGGNGSRIINNPAGPGAPVITDPPPPPPTLSVTKIMAFGDSLTEGESLGRLFGPPLHDTGTPGVPTSYPFKLHATLISTYTGQVNDIRVFNAGLGGENAVGSAAKDRLVIMLDRHRPEIVLVLHGVNNVNARDPVLTIVEAIEEMVEDAYQSGVKHVFLGNLPPQIPTTKATGGARIAEFNSWLPSIAAEEGATLVDVHSNINTQTMLMPDGLHLNESGNAKLAELFYTAIKARYHKEPGQ